MCSTLCLCKPRGPLAGRPKNLACLKPVQILSWRRPLFPEPSIKAVFARKLQLNGRRRFPSSAQSLTPSRRLFRSETSAGSAGHTAAGKPHSVAAGEKGRPRTQRKDVVVGYRWRSSRHLCPAPRNLAVALKAARARVRSHARNSSQRQIPLHPGYNKVV